MLTPAQHFSARNPFDRNRALWGGFVLRAGGARIYFAGDTAYGSFFRDVRLRLGSIDLALLPIGAYEPRWFMQPQHMNPEEAVRAFSETGADQALGHHWGTFRLTNEGIEQPLIDLASALDAQSVPPERFRALRPGETWEG
jgi:L-ascorbate metabolism protein UlaG (beta-lactamase superfamily)